MTIAKTYPSWKREYIKEWQSKKRADGFCPCCLKRKATDGKKVCEFCRSKKQSKRRTLTASGVCGSCLVRDVLPGFTTCNTCTESRRAHYQENRVRLRKEARDRIVRVRRKVFDHYGNACACCGETGSWFLTLDHIDNDGYQERAITGSGSTFYAWVVKNNFPANLQTLCCNCNMAKHLNGGTCPHSAG